MDSCLGSTLDSAMTPYDKATRMLSFKDFRGFKKIENIK